jgi:hypothetical protein
MWVKSAIMTGATTKDNQDLPIQGAEGNATPFEMGAGEVVPAKAFDPGLVYDSTVSQWLKYTCGIGVDLSLSDGTTSCGVGRLTPTELNYPTIAAADVIGKQTITRIVTNTEPYLAAYKAGLTAPSGFTAKVTPSVLLIKPRGTATFTVTLTHTAAAMGAYSFGALTWSDLLGHRVTSTIAARAIPTSVPPAVSGNGASGTVAVTAKIGFTGPLTTAGNGLYPATVHTASLVTDAAGFNQAAPAAGPGTARVDFTVPADAELARFQTLAADYPTGTDIDVFVYQRRPSGLTAVGLSAGGTADESVNLTAPGDYTAFIDLFANPAGSTAPLTVKGYEFEVLGHNNGNFTVTPASSPVTSGQSVPVTIAWNGLDPAQHYLGIVDYGDGSAALGQTLVSIN